MAVTKFCLSTLYQRWLGQGDMRNKKPRDSGHVMASAASSYGNEQCFFIQLCRSFLLQALLLQ